MIRLLCGALSLAFIVACGEQRDESVASISVPVGFVAEQGSAAIEMNGTLVESVGLETLGGVFTPVLEAGEAVPCERAQLFGTAVDDQGQITITVYRGSAERVRDSHLVGNFRISGFPPAARGVPQIEALFMATEHDLRLLATDKRTSRECRLERVDSGG